MRRRIALLLAACCAAAPAAADAARPPVPGPPAEQPRVTLSSDRAVPAGGRAGFRGRVTPPRPGARLRVFRGSSLVASTSVRRDGRYYVSARVGSPGPYRARVAGAVSGPVLVTIRPDLAARLVGEQRVGSDLRLVAEVAPRAAGRLRVRVLRGDATTYTGVFGGSARVQLGTSDAGGLRVEVDLLPARGYALRHASLSASLRLPELRPGSQGPPVVALRRRLAALGYAVPGGGGSFTWELRDSVYAFQKVQGLARDGVVGDATWRRLADPQRPRPRYASPADHIEVDKARQVLFVVRDGRIATILPVSTAGIPGYFTPTGRFAVYRKVPGLDPSPLGVLLNPLYFVGGYAIHGNPSVPPYPASHGCIRIPNWASYGFYSAHGYGETVYVY